MNNNNTKFTATLVEQNTKNAIVALRNETNLSEKELMTLVVDVALEHKSDIVTRAEAVNAANTAAKAERKKASYEALKAKLQAARTQKDPKKTKTTKSKPAPAPVPAPADTVTA
jgi:hypothetical protein